MESSWTGQRFLFPRESASSPATLSHEEGEGLDGMDANRALHTYVGGHVAFDSLLQATSAFERVK